MDLSSEPLLLLSLLGPLLLLLRLLLSAALLGLALLLLLAGNSAERILLLEGEPRSDMAPWRAGVGGRTAQMSLLPTVMTTVQEDYLLPHPPPTPHRAPPHCAPQAVAITFVEVVVTTRQSLMSILERYPTELNEVRRTVVRLSVMSMSAPSGDERRAA